MPLAESLSWTSRGGTQKTQGNAHIDVLGAARLLDFDAEKTQRFGLGSFRFGRGTFGFRLRAGKGVQFVQKLFGFVCGDFSLSQEFEDFPAFGAHVVLLSKSTELVEGFFHGDFAASDLL